MSEANAEQTVVIAAATIEFLGGDGSYVVSVSYRDEAGEMVAGHDRFSFPTAAKLKKFINKTLLA